MIKYPAESDGVITRIWEAGSGPGTVLLLHEVGLRLDWWRKNFSDLADRDLRTVAVDFPGHGFAAKHVPRSELRLADLTVFAAGIIDGLEMTRPVVVGAGLGATVALDLAKQRPDLVESLVLIAHLGVVQLPDPYRARLVAAVRDTTATTALRRTRRQTADPSFSTSEWLEDEVNINRSPGGPEYLELYADLIDRLCDGGAVGAAKEVETHVLWGEQDEIAPVELLGPTAAALGAYSMVLPGAGHAAYVDRFEGVDGLVAALATRDRQGAA